MGGGQLKKYITEPNMLIFVIMSLEGKGKFGSLNGQYFGVEFVEIYKFLATQNASFRNRIRLTSL